MRHGWTLPLAAVLVAVLAGCGTDTDDTSAQTAVPQAAAKAQAPPAAEPDSPGLAIPAGTRIFVPEQRRSGDLRLPDFIPPANPDGTRDFTVIYRCAGGETINVIINDDPEVQTCNDVVTQILMHTVEKVAQIRVETTAQYDIAVIGQDT